MAASIARNNRVRGFLALLGAALLFGTTGAFIKILSDYYTEPGQLILRSAVIVMIVLALSRLMRAKFDIRRDQIKYLAAIGLLYALSTTCFVYAVTSVKASSALFMLYVGTIVATQALGKFMFREKFGKRNIVTLLILGGALLMYLQPISPATVSIGLLLAGAGGVFEALSYAVRKKKEAISKESITVAQAVGGLAMGLAFLTTSSGVVVSNDLDMTAVGVMLALGAIYVGIGYLITYGMRHYSLGMGSVVLSSDMLFALIINALLIHQVPTGYEIAGSLLIFACIVYTTDFRSSRADDSDEAPGVVYSPEPD